MCLTAEMFAAFLNILSPEIITSTPGEVTIHATAGDKVWIALDEFWCTELPEVHMVEAD